MAGIADNLLDSAKIIVDTSLKSLKFDKTILCEISRVVDADKGEYKVYYEGNQIMTAYSNDTSFIYKQGDQVLVKVPMGNFSNKKTIEGYSNGKSIININNLSNYISEEGPEFFNYFDYNKDLEWSLKPAGVIIGEDSDYRNITIIPGKTSFDLVSKNYRKLKISADFHTNFMSTPISGRYKLVFTFNGDNTYSATLGFDNFEGDPLNYTYYSTQSVIVDLPVEITTLDKIDFIAEDFKFEKTDYSGDNYHTATAPQDIKRVYETGCDLNEEDVIFVKNIKLQFAQVVDLTQYKYYLSIDTPDGVEKGNDDLRLVGNLTYSGTKIADELKNCSYSWFVKDLSVTSATDENYRPEGGLGWKWLATEIDKYVYTITGEFTGSKIYKLVAVTENGTKNSKEVTIYSAGSADRYELVKRNGFLTIVDKEEPEENPNGVWTVTRDQSPQFIPGESNSIELTPWYIYTPVRFDCQVKGEGGIVLADLFYILQPLTNEDNPIYPNLNVIFDNRLSYFYNANGSIDSKIADIEQVLTPTRVGEIEGAVRTEWWLGNIQLNTTSQNPNDSMFTNIYIGSDDIVHFKIRPYLDRTKLNNILIYKIFVGEQEYTFNAYGIFEKQGDYGTNGSNLVCEIESGGHKNFAVLDMNLSSQKVNVQVHAYSNGNEVTLNSDIQWYNVMDSGVSCGEGTSATIDYGAVDITKNIFLGKVSVTYEGQTVYRIFPIYISKGYNLDNNVLNSIPTEIVYSSSGYNPQIVGSDTLSGTDWGLKVNNAAFSLSGNKILPNTYYDGAIIDGTLALRKNNDADYFYATIPSHLNVYGNENINGWDGQKVEINEDTYVFAPEIGAGAKNGDENKFTGVLMGKMDNKYGLYGFNEGVSTFGFTQEGKGYIGAGQGQIYFDGEEAIIKGSTGDSELNNFMELKLSNDNLSANDKAVNIVGGLSSEYAEKTVVEDNEHLYIVSLDPEDYIDQVVYLKKTGEYYYSQETPSIPSAIYEWIDATQKFYVKYDGSLYATGATISGDIDAKSLKLHGDSLADIERVAQEGTQQYLQGSEFQNTLTQMENRILEKVTIAAGTGNTTYSLPYIPQTIFAQSIEPEAPEQNGIYWKYTPEPNENAINSPNIWFVYNNNAWSELDTGATNPVRICDRYFYQSPLITSAPGGYGPDTPSNYYYWYNYSEEKWYVFRSGLWTITESGYSVKVISLKEGDLWSCQANLDENGIPTSIESEIKYRKYVFYRYTNTTSGNAWETVQGYLEEKSSEIRQDVDEINLNVSRNVTVSYIKSSAEIPSNPENRDLIFCIESFGSYVKNNWYRYNGSAWIYESPENITIGERTESNIEQTFNNISAKVSSTGGVGETFGWKLNLTDGFVVQHNNNNVIQVPPSTSSKALIAGWEVTENSLQKTNNNNVSVVGMYSGANTSVWSDSSLVNGGANSTIRIFAGALNQGESSPSKYRFEVLEDGSLYAKGAKISGDITATSLTIAPGAASSINLSSFNDDIEIIKNSDFTITKISNTGILVSNNNGTIFSAIGGSSPAVELSGFTAKRESNRAYLYSGKSSYNGSANGVYIGTDGIGVGSNGAFYVSSGGKLYATGATINGAITATSLTIASGGTIDSKIAKASDIPTSTSDLNNDSGYITSSYHDSTKYDASNPSGFQNITGVTSIVNGVVTTDFVNALGITAKQIRVASGSSTVFSANADSGSVTIGGFTVNSTNLQKGSFYIYSSDNNGSARIEFPNNALSLYTSSNAGVVSLGGSLYLYASGGSYPRTQMTNTGITYLDSAQRLVGSTDFEKVVKVCNYLYTMFGLNTSTISVSAPPSGTYTSRKELHVTRPSASSINFEWS